MRQFLTNTTNGNGHHGHALVTAASCEIVKRLQLHRVTGTAYVRIDATGGDVRSVRIAIEENFRPL